MIAFTQMAASLRAVFGAALVMLALGAAPAAAQGLIRDAEIEDTLRVYTDAMLVAAGLEPSDVSIYIVGDNTLNAFVAGGQNIFVHTGLILAADTPNELIGVLAHETGHIAGGHLARQREAVNKSMRTALISIGLGLLAIASGAPVAGAVLMASSSNFAMGNMVRHTQVQESAADQAALDYLEDKMDAAGGVLDAQTMADTFNALRSNDLVWNYVVDNYYMGKQPAPFDLLYWNSDQTRMPKNLHLFYLRKFYRDNALTEGKLTLMGDKLSLKDVTIPIFMQGSKEDHIAPAKSVYRSALSFGGPVEFVVAGSGHIAGVINHPDAKKYQYWTNQNLKGAVEDWFAFAQEHPGSWWPYWDQWLSKLSGDHVPARDPANGPNPPLADAPGDYVKVRSNAG